VWTCYRFYGGEPSTLQVFHQTAYKAHLPEQLQAVVPEYNDEQDVVKVCSKLLEKLIEMPEIGERVKDDLRMLDEVVAAVVTVRVEDAFFDLPSTQDLLAPLHYPGCPGASPRRRRSHGIFDGVWRAAQQAGQEGPGCGGLRRLQHRRQCGAGGSVGA
jgi:hypothetical protein